MKIFVKCCCSLFAKLLNICPQYLSTKIFVKFSQIHCSSVANDKAGGLVAAPPVGVPDVEGYEELKS